MRLLIFPLDSRIQGFHRKKVKWQKIKVLYFFYYSISTLIGLSLQFNPNLFQIIVYVGCTKMSYTFRDDEDDA